MGSAGRRDDEEAANGYESDEQQFEPYHDDPDHYDADEETVEADAPLGGGHRTSTELDGHVLRLVPSWKDRLARRIPPRLKSAWKSTKTWVKGPQPPRVYTITPLFPKVQYAPVALLERYAPKKIHKFGLLVIIYASWLFAFSLVLYQSSFSTYIPGYGTPFRLGCHAKYWTNGNKCGLNGDECRPFEHAHLAFRCPASCRDQQVFQPHAVGTQNIIYQPLIIGGPADNETGFEGELVNNAVYRGDSFICGAAIHAGFIDNEKGGCGVLTLTGEQPEFVASEHNGVGSVGFDSYFPQSFGFIKGTRTECKDMRWPALIVTVVATTILSIFTTSPAVFFWSIFVMVFFNVALATDPPNLVDYRRLLSVAFERFLPACFCAWVTYRYSVRRTLTNLTAQIEKAVLWLGPLWAGALNNYTFDNIPLQRLTPHDIQTEPGAIPALITVVLVIFFIALGQAWAFRQEGRMPRYLVIYAIFVVALLLFVTLPGLSLRIHHYILALLLLPGTSFQNRPSLIYQGLLVGLFINGIARWGFASIIEMTSDIMQGIPRGTWLPEISVLAIGARNITFNLGPLPAISGRTGRAFDGISILVNDVERFRGYGDNEDYWPDGWIMGGNFTWTWKRHKLGTEMGLSDGDEDDSNDEVDAQALVLPEYFRFAYLSGSNTNDYTKAGKWDVDNSWTPMERGPS